jgi:prolyl-tRNA editing enzyme YbaK/EbsC (Cys-tRNA(Pro) deacylase)
VRAPLTARLPIHFHSLAVTIVLEAGSHERSLRMQAAQLVRLTGAQVADVSRDEP